ncbi:hypothetical protein KIN20_016556 [Parelaphostrongylus tenuis]|uniref:Large ribosomal subunit protein mL50 n=1 Tax=Parelaphostrongylus tenuis TaxID=148309 RepID=A0AAD5MYP1_PARTN|nr:hypothetical protein KIN20_016556 [Parelaphostrongylus tenuis]
MRASSVNYVRARALLSSLFGMSKSTLKGDTVKLSEQEQENLKKVLPSLRTDSPKSKSQQVNSTSYDPEDILNYRIDEDSIRARGLLKYRYNYQPPSNVKDVVLKTANQVLSDKAGRISDLTAFIFNDNNVKAEIILTLSEQLKHCPTNSRLMHIKSVQDLIDFYEEPVENVTSYIKLARMKSKPRNLYMMEQAHRFHPEDVEAWHGGVTGVPWNWRRGPWTA